MKNILFVVLLCLPFFGLTQNNGYNYYDSSMLSKKDTLVHELGLAIENAFYNQEKKFLFNLFNSELFSTYFLVDEENNKDLAYFNEGFKTGLHEVIVKFYNSIQLRLENGDDYSMINYSEDEYGNYYIRFRLFGEDGINYHEFFIPNQGEILEISDVYILLTGEYLSETLTPLYLTAIKDIVIDYEIVEETSNIDLESMLTIIKIKELISKGDLVKAKEIFDSKIPKNIYDEKLVIILRASLYNIEDKEYTELLSQLGDRATFAASKSLASLDVHFINKDYEEALKEIDVIYEYSEDDFLDLFRANIHYEIGNLELAEFYYLKFIRNYPNYYGGYENLFLLLYQREDYSLMIEQMNKLIEFTGYPKLDLVVFIEENYPNVLESEIYINWKNTEE